MLSYPFKIWLLDEMKHIICGEKMMSWYLTKKCLLFVGWWFNWKLLTNIFWCLYFYSIINCVKNDSRFITTRCWVIKSWSTDLWQRWIASLDNYTWVWIKTFRVLSLWNCMRAWALSLFEGCILLLSVFEMIVSLRVLKAVAIPVSCQLIWRLLVWNVLQDWTL